MPQPDPDKRPADREIPNENSILAYLHCARCLTAARASPTGRYAPGKGRIEAGWTKLGLQVVCKDCGGNILHVDFEGMQHPANITTKRLKGEGSP